MIRPATAQDIPAIVRLVAKLHEVAHIVLPLDETVTARFLHSLLGSPAGLLLVAGDGKPNGFLAASVGFASIAKAPLAIEHGWFSEGSDGLRLLRRYEAWAKEQGCSIIRMSTPPGADRVNSILYRSGYALAEQAWTKVLP